MRLNTVVLLALVTACAPPPQGGVLGDGAANSPDIVSVDSGAPPTRASVRLEKEAYAVLMFVAPGHSATVLYPADSSVDNRLGAGSHDIAFQIPRRLLPPDSTQRAADRARASADSATRTRGRIVSAATAAMPPLMPDAVTYLLVVTSPRPLVYSRIVEKTVGWSIPLEDMEALNAVAKQVKNTIPEEPREWAAAYHVLELTSKKK